MSDMCGDNRFKVIDRAKRAIIEGTNIESRPEEMAVLDSFIFRAWQMGWLWRYDYEGNATPENSEMYNEAYKAVQMLDDWRTERAKLGMRDNEFLAIRHALIMAGGMLRLRELQDQAARKEADK